MKIFNSNNLDFFTVHDILTSKKISESQKLQFVRSNRVEIKNMVANHISSAEYKYLMQNRPLKKFRPLKNSYAKRGDKIILAKALNIQPSQVNDYIKNVKEDLNKVDDLSFLPKDKIDTIKEYVYRHGSKDDLVVFLDYELTKTTDILKTLYRTLEYHNGGVADYFIRPIHRMDNKTLIKIYSIINKHLNEGQKNGTITEIENQKISKWALIQIYKIQHNSKFINALKTLKTLNG